MAAANQMSLRGCAGLWVRATPPDARRDGCLIFEPISGQRGLAEITLNLDNSGVSRRPNSTVMILRSPGRSSVAKATISSMPNPPEPGCATAVRRSATGARSSAWSARSYRRDRRCKPNDRRALLEEAANITGLHSRRHEADCGYAVQKRIWSALMT